MPQCAFQNMTVRRGRAADYFAQRTFASLHEKAGAVVAQWAIATMRALVSSLPSPTPYP